MSKVCNPNDRVFYVYVLFRPWDGSPCYVGKGKGGRSREHAIYGGKHPNRHLANIFKKAGGAIPLVKIRDGLTEVEAFEVERAFIAALRRQIDGGILVNLTIGGDGPTGFTHSDETKAVVGVKSKGAWSDPETRARTIARQNEGRNSEEYRAKRSAISKAMWADPVRAAALREKRRTRFNDPAQRERTSSATKAAMENPEVRARLSAAQKERCAREGRVKQPKVYVRKPHSAETREKMRIAQALRRDRERKP